MYNVTAQMYTDKLTDRHISAEHQFTHFNVLS